MNRPRGVPQLIGPIPRPMSDGDLLAACGRALFGERFASELARALDVADRTVRRWLSGEWPVPTEAWVAIYAMIRERSMLLDSLGHHLRPRTVARPPGAR